MEAYREGAEAGSCTVLMCELGPVNVHLKNGVDPVGSVLHFFGNCQCLKEDNPFLFLSTPRF